MRASMSRSTLPQTNSSRSHRHSHSSSSSSSSSSKKGKETKQVKFGRLLILEFPLELGDNPSVSNGAPTQLSWKCQFKDDLDIDIYEYVRPKRRYKRELALSNPERARRLFLAGYSVHEIAVATIEAQEMKEKRAITWNRKRWDSFNILFESTTRAYRTAIDAKQISVGAKMA